MSNYSLLVALSIATLALVLGVGIWQYLSVKRSKERRGETSASATHSFVKNHPDEDKP